MGLAIYYSSLIPQPRLKSLKIRAVDAYESVVLRSHVLERVDEELVKGNERAALSLVKDLQGKPGGLRCFGVARQPTIELLEGNISVPRLQGIASLATPLLHVRISCLPEKVPQRLYTLDELKLNGIETSSLLSPVDMTLGSIERNLQFAAVLGGLSAWVLFGLNQLQILFLSVGFLFLWSVDLVVFGGGVSGLVLDTIGHTISQKYHNRVIQHEAGHFLIAYLLGVLPKGYTLSSLEALKKEGSLNVQAGTAFVDFEFLEEVNTGKVSAKTLNRFSCIALAGVATEYLLFGYSEGGLADIDKLDGLLKGLGFTQKKADSQVRWAVLNTILILRRHEGARSKLAKAMSLGMSVGFCINTIEESIDGGDV